ncbi:toast rack family protein [Longimicrobium sp.]|uniref:toast rack family protein n=1 Tax=Longimicrobium sp. TaxID=2029185 RepID=UPI002BDDFFA1|nr:toast rack family protein [Longimicrobium sp.]HSU12593.1 toast rack family protein [Longimicrobium sp.]
MSDLFPPRVRGALAVAALATVAAACGHDAEARPSARMRGMTSARQVAGEKQLAVQVQYGAGRLRVSPAEGGLLYRLDLRYDEAQFRPVAEYDREAGRLRLGVEGRDGHGGSMDSDQAHATVELSPEVPMDLSLQFGAGEANVDLGGMSLRDVSVQTGASQTSITFAQPNRITARRVRVQAGAAELRVSGLGNARAQRFEFEGGMGQATLDFGGAWNQNATASVRMGVGAVRLRLPRSLGVKVTKDSFLTSFDPTGMVKRGDAWFSNGYESSQFKLDLSINAAVGSIDIDWID